MPTQDIQNRPRPPSYIRIVEVEICVVISYHVINEKYTAYTLYFDDKQDICAVEKDCKFDARKDNKKSFMIPKG